MDDFQLDEIVRKKVNFMTERYFTQATGGNNRMWAKRYSSMANQWKMIVGSPAFSEDFKEGYKLCMSHFHEINSGALNSN